MRNDSRRKYPERARARNAVQRAVAAGRLIRPEACGRCGVECRTEASHDDYSEPLRVEWLCRSCHVRKDLAEQCPNGHPYTPENTRLTSRGHRMCRVCRNAVKRRYRQKASNR